MELREPVTAVIVGATGLVGGKLLDMLIAEPQVVRLATVGRRAPTVDADKLTHHVVDLAGEIPAAMLAGDVVYCCLGTTIAKAGSKAAFRAVDFDLVMHSATAARSAGTPTFIVVSSLGADSRSNNFYLRTKGETEQALTALGFERLGIVRPSLLLGARDESRPAEALGQLASRLINPLLLGGLRKYRSIDADSVARAMIALAQERFSGVHIVESDELQRLA